MARMRCRNKKTEKKDQRTKEERRRHQGLRFRREGRSEVVALQVIALNAAFSSRGPWTVNRDLALSLSELPPKAINCATDLRIRGARRGQRWERGITTREFMDELNTDAKKHISEEIVRYNDFRGAS
ncbi:hypothetical protein B0H10DRAFT_1943088 [Mycena sp. CBHHK59/15]|nr:hypothetical protein B0H10DRAFT_1943088 [Mycena sp. CBHHK59/15]